MQLSFSNFRNCILTFVFLILSGNAFASDTKVQLALNWKPEPQFGGFYAAQINDEYKKNGLDVQLLEGGSGTPTVQMLANGKVDFAIVSAEEILINNDRNPKNTVVALFAAFQTNPQVIICRKELHFKNLGDLFASKTTLAWQSGLAYAQFLKTKFKPTDLHLVPYLGGVTTILKDKDFCQQGFSTSEPITAENNGLKVDQFLVADEGFNPYTTVLAVRADVLQKDPKLAEKMVHAVRAGWKAYLQDPAPTNSKMSGLNKAMEPKTFAQSSAAQSSLTQSNDTNAHGLGYMSEQRWDLLASQMNKLGLIHNIPTITDQYRIIP